MDIKPQLSSSSSSESSISSSSESSDSDFPEVKEKDKEIVEVANFEAAKPKEKEKSPEIIEKILTTSSSSSSELYHNRSEASEIENLDQRLEQEQQKIEKSDSDSFVAQIKLEQQEKAKFKAPEPEPEKTTTNLIESSYATMDNLNASANSGTGYGSAYRPYRSSGGPATGFSYGAATQDSGLGGSYNRDRVSSLKPGLGKMSNMHLSAPDQILAESPRNGAVSPAASSQRAGGLSARETRNLAGSREGLFSHLDVAELQRKLAQVESNHQRDRNELEHEKTTSNSLRNEIKLLKAKIDECQRNLNEEADRRNTLNNQHNRIQKQLDQKVSQNERLMKDLQIAKESNILDKDFAAECKKLREKMEENDIRFSRDMADSTMKAKNYENTIETLNKKIQKLKKESDDLKLNLEDLGSGKIENQQLLKRNNELESRISTLEDEITQREELLAKAASKGQKDQQHYEKQILDYKNKINLGDAKNDEVSDELKRTREKIKSTANDLKYSRQELETANKTMNELSLKITRLENQADLLANEKEQALANLENMSKKYREKENEANRNGEDLLGLGLEN